MAERLSDLKKGLRKKRGGGMRKRYQNERGAKKSKKGGVRVNELHLHDQSGPERA